MTVSARDVLKMTGTIPESVVFGPVLSDSPSRDGLESKGPFRFVSGDGLWRDGQPVPLPPRAVGVLTALLATPGTVVSKQALMDAVWPNTFVTESSLLEAIGLVRDALGDDRRHPVYIQTVHRRGYRFIGTIGVPRLSRADEAPPAPFFSGPEWRPIVAACVSYVIATIGVALVFALMGHPRPVPVMVESRPASPGFAISHTGSVIYLPERGAPIIPSWTPDGLELALAFSKAGPFTLLTSGPTPLIAHAGGQFPTSWSPDNTRLAYTEFQPMTGADIWVLDVRTGARRPLARTWFDETWARFSPDGRWITYMSNESGRWEVYVRPALDEGRAVRVSSGGGAWPSWSNDSATVFFSAADATLAASIRTVPALTVSGAIVVHQGGSRTPRRAELRVVLEWFSELAKRDG